MAASEAEPGAFSSSLPYSEPLRLGQGNVLGRLCERHPQGPSAGGRPGRAAAIRAGTSLFCPPRLHPTNTPSAVRRCRLVRLPNPFTRTQAPCQEGHPVAFLPLRAAGLFRKGGRKACHPSGRNKEAVEGEPGKAVLLGAGRRPAEPGFRVRPFPRVSPVPCQLCGLKQVIRPLWVSVCPPVK